MQVDTHNRWIWILDQNAGYSVSGAYCILTREAPQSLDYCVGSYLA